MTTRGKPVAELRTAMPTIIRDTPPGYDWGWYSREEPRMHLQSTDEEHRFKVWMEDRGRRVFQPEAKIPAKVLKPLQKQVATHRQFIEDRWVRLMLHKDWIEAHLTVPCVVLNMYPNTPSRFSRTIDLTVEFPGAREEIMQLTPRDIRLSKEKGSLEIWSQLPEADRMDMRLSPVIWEG